MLVFGTFQSKGIPALEVAIAAHPNSISYRALLYHDSCPFLTGDSTEQLLDTRGQILDDGKEGTIRFPR
jgi:hypothetical protein